MLNYLEDETIIEIVFWKKDVVHFHLDLATWAAWPLTDTLTLAESSCVTEGANNSDLIS